MRQLRSEEGSSLVEFALSSAILFLCLFGIFGFCGALYSYNFVSDAAHDASRYASVRGSSCVGLSDCNITSAQIQTYVRGLGYPGIVSSDLTASGSWAGSSHAPGSTVTVTVTYTYPLRIPYWKQSGRILNLTSTSQMTISQ